MTIDFRTCPNCRQVLVVREVAKCLVTYDMNIHVNPETGELKEADANGDSETWYDTASHKSFECAYCAEDLPEDYQAAISEVYI